MMLKPKEKTVDELNENEIERMEYLLWSLYHNGQIQDYWDVVKTGDNLTVFITQVDIDSLDEKYDGEYVKKNKKELEPVFDISYKTIGTHFYAEKICSCKNPSFYILYTANNHFGSPVICGDCGNSIPMYKLPLRKPDKNGGGDYFFEMDWEIAWKEVESLWYAGLADKWTERQIINPKSALAKWGREWICKDFEKVTEKKFYYFLFDANCGNKFDLQAKCPECGKNWRKQKIKEEEWSFCDDCRLSTKKYWKNE